jgi:DNA-directed RNA polymerase specialized sigma24 family protein
MSRKQKMYFDNKEVEEKILLYQNNEKDREKILNELFPVFDLLIKGVISKYKLLRRNYINDDLYQEAWTGIMEVILKWNKVKGDAFSYFTAVAKNKIFWYLKNNYNDTSLNANEQTKINIENVENTFELSSEDLETADILSIKDYIEKITLEKILIDYDEDYKIILESIKNKILLDDNLKYVDIVKEIQKESKIPKRKIKYVLDSIYLNFTGD